MRLSRCRGPEGQRGIYSPQDCQADGQQVHEEMAKGGCDSWSGCWGSANTMERTLLMSILTADRREDELGPGLTWLDISCARGFLAKHC